MIKPTVGRVVLYRPFPSDNLAGASDSEPLAAIVTRVWSDTCVNLCVFDANGVTSSRTSVLLWQEENERPTHGFCEWMPYQKAVASGAQAPTLHA